MEFSNSPNPHPLEVEILLTSHSVPFSNDYFDFATNYIFQQKYFPYNRREYKMTVFFFLILNNSVDYSVSLRINMLYPINCVVDMIATRLEESIPHPPCSQKMPEILPGQFCIDGLAKTYDKSLLKGKKFGLQVI